MLGIGKEMLQNFKSYMEIAFEAICFTIILILLGVVFATYTSVRPRNYLVSEDTNDHHWTPFSGMELNAKEDTEDVNIANWVVLLTVNSGYLAFFQNWFWYFNRLQLPVPVVVIADDDESFQKLKSLYEHNGSVKVEKGEETNKELVADNKSPAFKRLVRERPSHILKHLKSGKNVLFCDVDSVWLQNPFPYFSGDFDIWAQLDGCRIRAGFLAIESNNRTINFISEWDYYLVVQNISSHDQHDVSVVLPDNPYKWKLQLKTLDTELFPAGNLYFNKFDDKQRSKAVVVHNIYIGIQKVRYMEYLA